MTTLFKWTRPDWTTHGGCQWGPGVEHITDGEGRLCGPGFTHWYTHPLLAVLLDPIHGIFGPDALLWEGEGDIAKTDHGLKVGCVRGRTLKVIEAPRVTSVQHAAFGILCSLAVPQSDSYRTWASNWLSGDDRSRESAWTACSAESKEAPWTAYSAKGAAVAAAQAAARAAWAEKGETAWAAAFSTKGAARAAAVDSPLDLIALAQRAMETR